MKHKLAFFIMVSFLYSCSSVKKTTVINDRNSKVANILHFAKTFQGTQYKYGGTTKKGMDCSGLIYTTFKQEHILLPRISKDMALKGIQVPKQKIRKGDLVFFITGKRNRINHVGLVTKIVNKEVFFIHASTTRGVIISSLAEKYYKSRFVKAKRVL